MKTLEALISEVLGIPASSVRDDLKFQAIPEWDSLNHVNLILALESHLGVTIDADQLTELGSVAAIRAFVNSQHGGSGPA